MPVCRARAWFIVLSVVAAAAGVLALAQDRAATVPRTLIAGARLLDAAAGSYLPPSYVLIEGDRIVSVTPGPPGTLPEGTQTIDAKGATLVPGLVDAHAQAAPTGDLDADYFALMNLAHGVTAVRALNVRTAWGVAQRQRVRSGRTAGPRLYISGRGIDQAGRADLWLFDAPDAQAAGGEASRQAASGVDWVAGYDHVTAGAYRAMVAAVAGKPVRVAARPGAASLSELAAAAVHSIESLDHPLAGQRPGSTAAAAAERWPALQARDAAAIVRALVRADVTVVPLLAVNLVRAYPEEVARDRSLAMLTDGRRANLVANTKSIRRPEIAASRADWTARNAFLKRFLDAGGRIAAGTGFETAGYPVPGAGLHTELATLVRAGLAPADAIRAATIRGADLLGASGQIGAIKPGMAADLIIVSGDPLSSVGDLAKITHVIRGGEVLDPKELLGRAMRARVGPQG